MKFSYLILSFLLIFSANAKLLDKTAIVFNDKIVTYSEIKRIKENLAARLTISPQIYTSDSMSIQEITKLKLERLLIRSKLAELNYNINDEQVEQQIRDTEKKLGLTREQLLDFLTSNNMAFDEYFEIVRESIEFNIFFSRVVRPLISITEQEIKNTFYNMNTSNSTLTFKYTLVDFSIPKNKLSKSDVRNLSNIMKDFQVKGILPPNFEDLSTNVLGDVTEEGLTSSISKVLKGTNEGSFSAPVLLGNDYHVFFVKQKDVIESDLYLKARPRIEAQLFQQLSIKVTKLWFQREESKHYIRKFL